MHPISLGNFELTVLSDGTYPLDGGGFFGVVPKVLWSKKVQADGQNRVSAGLNSLLVRTADKNVLIETGIGSKLSEKMVRIYGQPAKLLENLHAVGLGPEDIDVVINSHLHFDHCGWNTVRATDGKVSPTFPRAKYYAPQGEWEYAQHPSERDAISFLSENYDPLVASGQMRLLRGGEEILPGISVRTYPGHTAHMQAIFVTSGGKTACYISDLIPTSAHLEITWGMAFDLYPLQTIESRKQYYAGAIANKWLTVFTHDPLTPWGYVRRRDDGRMELESIVD